MSAPLTIAPQSLGHAPSPEIVAPFSSRPQVGGKFFFVGDRKLYVRGVTYGPFAPQADGGLYGEQQRVRDDFAMMAASGVNAVRTYTEPPRWMLDEAQRQGLRLLVGLPWTQHVAFLDSRRFSADIVRHLETAVAALAGHPAILGLAIGNEIAAPVVRWYGHKRIESFLHRLYLAAKNQDPAALVTYVNYPSTEYLDLPFVDFVSFNVYLEARRSLLAYTARLQNIAGDRPLVMAEVGLDAMRHGEAKQARALGWQIRAVTRAGCAGAFVFSWTDEWHRGGVDVEDWAFGLTTRRRRPRRALAAVTRAFQGPPADPTAMPPGISVVVCVYNGASTIRRCLEHLARLEYPRYEVVVIDDGSTDETAAIAGGFDVRLIRTPNRGLSNARNTGWRAAQHDIIAYVDADAWPDRQWLTYLADSFARTRHAGVGGTNVPPSQTGLVQSAVALSPGGPVHVLLTDDVAEHIPGCNMAFRKECLEAIGGFDPQFRIAGDDVDVCWRLQQRGWTLGFNPAAMVWHLRRETVGAFWRQQVNYGKAEADLERKWPQKYNAAGHLTWAGRMYGNRLLSALTWWSRRRIYHGTWGGALFQSVYHAPENWLLSLPLMPEWYLAVLILAFAAGIGVIWPPMLGAVPLLALAVAIPVAHVVAGARRGMATRSDVRGRRRAQLMVLTTWLHLIQPAARLWGRMCRGLTPWRSRGTGGLALPIPRTFVEWTEQWQPHESRLRDAESALIAAGAVVVRGGDFDRWDFELRGGLFGAARVRLMVEEHGQGRQLARLHVWPRLAPRSLIVLGLSASIAVVAAIDREWSAATIFAILALLVLGRGVQECGRCVATFARMLGRRQRTPSAAAAATPATAHAHPAVELTLPGAPAACESEPFVPGAT